MGILKVHYLELGESEIDSGFLADFHIIPGRVDEEVALPELPIPIVLVLMQVFPRLLVHVVNPIRKTIGTIGRQPL